MLAHDVSPGLLQSYFVKDGGTFRVRSDIRSACVFATHDVTRDPLLSQLDLVSCYHVLGGLTEKRANRLLAGFHHALRERSFLLLGRGSSRRSSSARAARPFFAA